MEGNQLIMDQTMEENVLVLNEQIAKFMQVAIDETFMAAFQIHTRPEEWSIGRNTPLLLGSLNASQIIIKQKNLLLGTFIAAFSSDILRRILTQTANNLSIDQAMLDDVAAEITNMLFGLFKTTVNKAGAQIAMGIPATIHESPSLIATYAQAEKIILPFLADDQTCRLIIAQKQQ